MGKIKLWWSATRPKTLPASLSPVFLGICGAIGLAYNTPAGQQLSGATQPTPPSLFRLVTMSLLCLLVALFLQIGVNFANDYSDGIRGTDSAERLGPKRLTGSGAAQPGQVLRAALISFAMAAICGLILIIWAQTWWFILFGVAALLAGWFYTGGRHPYGYRAGIAELMVFIFFGLLATLGTVWVQVYQLNSQLLAGAAGLGLLSCALLMVNNLRDIPTDRQSGKMTLAVRLGDSKARKLVAGYFLLSWLFALYALTTSGVPLSTAIVLLIILAFNAYWSLTPIFSGATGTELIASLRLIGLATLFYGLFLGIPWAIYGF